MGVASIAGSNRLRWNRVSIAKPLVIGWQERLLAFSGRAFPLGSIHFTLPGPLAFEPFGYRAITSWDRKSVVSGQSVSVRAELGGPRRSKKNKKTNKSSNHKE